MIADDENPPPWSLASHLGVAPYPHDEKAAAEDDRRSGERGAAREREQGSDPAAAMEIASGDPVEMNPLTSQPQRRDPRRR